MSIRHPSYLPDLALKRHCSLPDELWTSEQTMAAINFVESHPIGHWNLDSSIPADQMQNYAELACTMLRRLYASPDYHSRESLEGSEDLFQTSNNIVRDSELPLVLRLLCGNRRGQHTAPIPHKAYARETLQLGVQIVVNRGHNRPAEVLHTLVDQNPISRAVATRARTGDENALHSVRSHAAHVMAADEHVRVQMLTVEEQLSSLLLRD